MHVMIGMHGRIEKWMNSTVHARASKFEREILQGDRQLGTNAEGVGRGRKVDTASKRSGMEIP